MEVSKWLGACCMWYVLCCSTQAAQQSQDSSDEEDYKRLLTSNECDQLVAMCDERSRLSQEFLDRRLWEITRDASSTDVNKELFNTAEELLEQGANPLQQINDCTQTCAIEHAFVRRDFGLLALLFAPKYGHFVNTPINGRTLLVRAEEDNDREMIQFLLAHGAVHVDYQPPPPPAKPSFAERIRRSKFMRALRALKRKCLLKKPESGGYTDLDGD